MTDNHPTRPSRHDPVTTPCPACGRPFTPAGRQQWCSGACRSLAYRRRQRTATPPVTIPTPTPDAPTPSTNATPAAPGHSANNAAKTAAPS
jgi:predicted nucleic acid-binding Zn ribbon protein